ncbi:PadR family transcriptional regulator [Bordetella genomosp. 1]
MGRNAVVPGDAGAGRPRHAHAGHEGRRQHGCTPAHARRHCAAGGPERGHGDHGDHGGRGGHGDHGGRGGHGRGGRGSDGDSWNRGRKFSSDDLQLMVLALLEAGASHGYELIKALGERSQGYYTPSPGMIYPTLTYIEEAGYATAQAEGSRKRYALTPTGSAHLETQRDQVELLFAKLAHIGRKMAWIQRAMQSEPPVLDADGADVATGWTPEFVAARAALREALVRRGGAPAGEQRRIAAILERATRAILEQDGGEAAVAAAKGA